MIEKYVFQWCLMENQILLIYKKLEGWTAGVWCWMFFSCRFQHTFSSNTAIKALDCDLGLYSVCMGQHTHFLCARDRVQPPLMLEHYRYTCTVYNFYLEKIFAYFLPPAPMGEIFYPMNFLSHVDDYIEPMVLFTAWMKIYSAS